MSKILKFIPYLFFLFINKINDLIFTTGKNATISIELSIFICVIYFLSDRLKNTYNQIIAKGWIVFFAMGLLNIDSVNRRTGVWNLKIEDATFFYFYCVGTFIAGLLIFENLIKAKPAEQEFENDIDKVTKTPFSFFMYL